MPVSFTLIHTGVPLVLEGRDGALMGEALLALQPSAGSAGLGSLLNCGSYESLGRSSNSSAQERGNGGGRRQLQQQQAQSPQQLQQPPPPQQQQAQSSQQHTSDGVPPNPSTSSSSSLREEGGGKGGSGARVKQVLQQQQQLAVRLERGGTSSSSLGSALGSQQPGARQVARLSPYLLHACRQQAYQTQIMEVRLGAGMTK
jgi:hypothetical protein